MKPLIAIPEPLQFPIKLIGAFILVILVGIGLYIGAVVQVYVLGWLLGLIFSIF
jgi:hypothetical protein